MSICLFQNKKFVSASGIPLTWKVECDAMPYAGNWEWAAARIAEQCEFGAAFGIPTGGIKFADACQRIKTHGSINILVVDDVWTTGKSIQLFCEKNHWWGEGGPLMNIHVWVLFSRVPVLPSWANALWSYTGGEPKQTE